jgi:serine/threonine protein kinase
MSLAQGTLIGDGLTPDRFRVRQPLGRGASSRVYLAWDRLHERDVALKLLDVGGGMEREACLHEARALARVRHPNVVTVYEVVIGADPPYLVMEYVEGEELERRLMESPADPAFALAVGRAIAAALVAAHEAGVLHRDVKPANVIVSSDGAVKLIDFGVARRAQEDGPEGPLGTPYYLPPELLSGSEADERADLYAVGVLLFRVLTRRHPFEAETLDDLRAQLDPGGFAVPDVRDPRPDVPVPLAEVIARCLAPRDERFPSAESLLLALERVGPTGARPLPATPYLGLAPFTADERGVFFGREEEVARVIGRLRVASTVTLVGASGAGKSSLALAGVAPAVEAGDLEAGGTRRRFRTARFSPGARPLEALCAALGQPEDRLRQAPERWWRLVRSDQPRRRAEESGLLLVVDQLEELVTVCADPEERAALGRALRGGLSAGPSVRVLITSRDDFLARLGAVEGLPEVLQTIHLVRPLDGEALRAAVVEPARAFGYAFEDEGMVERIVREVAGRSGTMPLLGFALRRLWEDRDEERRLLPGRALEQMGGIGGALARAADDLVRQLEGDGLSGPARAVLLELVTPEGTKRTRRLQELATAPGAAAVITRLRAARLLTGSDEALELAHESLVREWALLRRWIDETRARRELAADAQHAAVRWQSRGRPSELLWRGRPLEEARALLAARGGLAAEAMEFLRSSERHAGRQRRLRWLLAVGAVAVVATAVGIYIRGLALERDLARREAAADRAAVAAQRGKVRAERARARAVEERRKLLEAWVRQRRQLVADLNRTAQSGLREHILRRLAREGPPGVRLEPPPSRRVEVCLFGPARDLSMGGDWRRRTEPVARLLAGRGYVIGCQYPYVRTAARFRPAVERGLVQHAADLDPTALEPLLALLRRRHPSLEVRIVKRRRLFRTVDVLLPDADPAPDTGGP